MLDKKHVVDVPEEAIVKKDRTVLWTIEKRYIKSKQYNHDVRRMIGKTIDDNSRRMYPNDNFIELFPDAYNAALGKKLIPSSQCIGYYALVKAIVNQLPLYSLLYEVFGKEDTDMILDYAMYQIIYESDVSQHFESSMADKAMFSEKLRSDSYLSDYFRDHITEDQTDLFREKWCEEIIRYKKLRGVYLNVDGSNVDCEAEGVTLAELGNDKSHEKTSIVNMMYVVAPDGTPVTYYQYRGSTIDQKAVRYMILYLSHVNVKILGFCVDRGFCSKPNTDMLRANGIEFVMMMTSKPDGFAEARNQLRDLVKFNMEKWIDGTELFGDTTTVKMFKNDSVDTYLHMYFDSERCGSATTKLLRRINSAKRAASNAIRNGKAPNIPDDLREYIDLRKGRGPRTLEMRKDHIQEAINDMGFHGIATSKEMTALQAHDIYMARDSSEKQYMFMKSKLGMDKYRTASDESICGKQFVAFIAGIIRNEIRLGSEKLIKATERPDVYSVPAIIKEVGKTKIKRLPGNVYSLVNDRKVNNITMLNQFGVTDSVLNELAVIQGRRLKRVIK